MKNVEVVPPKPTGNRAVALMRVDILVEVQETDSYSDMVQQARDIIFERVLEGKGFLPFRSECVIIHDNTTVDVLKHRLTIDPQDGL